MYIAIIIVIYTALVNMQNNGMFNISNSHVNSPKLSMIITSIADCQKQR